MATRRRFAWHSHSWLCAWIPTLSSRGRRGAGVPCTRRLYARWGGGDRGICCCLSAPPAAAAGRCLGR